MVYVDFRGVFQEKETACVKALGQENELGTFAGEKKGCGWNSMHVSCLCAVGGGKRGQGEGRVLVWALFRHFFICLSNMQMAGACWPRCCVKQYLEDKDQSLEKLTVEKTDKSVVPHIIMR